MRHRPCALVAAACARLAADGRRLEETPGAHAAGPCAGHAAGQAWDFEPLISEDLFYRVQAVLRRALAFLVKALEPRRNLCRAAVLLTRAELCGQAEVLGLLFRLPAEGHGTHERRLVLTRT
jgi:hypothetical protein